MQTVGEQFLQRRPTVKPSNKKQPVPEPMPPKPPANVLRPQKSELSVKEMKEEIVDMSEKLRIKNLPQILQMRQLHADGKLTPAPKAHRGTPVR